MTRIRNLQAVLIAALAAACAAPAPQVAPAERRAAIERLNALCAQGNAEACALIVDLADADRVRRAQAARELSVFGDGL